MISRNKKAVESSKRKEQGYTRNNRVLDESKAHSVKYWSDAKDDEKKLSRTAAHIDSSMTILGALCDTVEYEGRKTPPLELLSTIGWEVPDIAKFTVTVGLFEENSVVLPDNIYRCKGRSSDSVSLGYETPEEIPPLDMEVSIPKSFNI